MSTRALGQAVGSQGQSLVTHIISSSGDWIARAQDEDFGIDLEAELAVPNVSGQLLKIQIKASSTIAQSARGIACKIPKKLALYADSCRLPVLLVRVDLARQRAWYLWLQEWLLERQRSGHRLADMPASLTHHIPQDQTLVVGLARRLRDIAQWRTRTQLVLTVHDAIRTSAAVYDYGVLAHLVALLDRVGAANEHFPANMVIDHAISLGLDLRGTPEGNEASSTLYAICRHFGRTFSADQVLRMVTRGDSFSRVGLNALGLLYTHAFEHVSGLNLVQRFLDHEDPRAAFYCHLRELHPGVEFLECVQGEYDLQFGGLAIDRVWKKTL